MQEKRKLYGIGLGLFAVLWLIWPSATMPASPTAVQSVARDAEKTRLTSVAPQASDPAPDHDSVRRIVNSEEAVVRIRVIDARTLNPIEGALVEFMSKPYTLDERLARLSKTAIKHHNSNLAAEREPPTEGNSLLTLMVSSHADKAIIRQVTSDADGLVVVSRASHPSFVWVSLGPAEGSARITESQSIQRVFIEPPITISVRTPNGDTSNERVKATLHVPGKAFGPIYSTMMIGDSQVFFSLWSLRSWLLAQSHELEGITVEFISAPEWPGAWLPVESPVPNPVILQSPPMPTRIVKGR